MNTKVRGQTTPASEPVALGIALCVLALSGCSKSDTEVSARSESSGAAASAAERPYLEAAKPFVEAIAARDYRKAYDYLSSHAKARMSPNQFVAPDDETIYKRNEAAAVQNLAPERFVQLLGPTEKAYGKPARLLDMHVFSTEPAALSGKAVTPEDKLDSMFAIGMMPASVPSDIRKASVRAKLLVELSPDQLAQQAKAMKTTAASLKADPDFQPYLNLKLVLVEDAGALKVGYFEFLPPGILD